MMEPAVRLPPVEQIGIVVRDVDRAVEFFGSVFGWGPFRVREGEQKGFTYDGRTGDCRLRMAFARSGDVEIELIQVLEGETPHSDFPQAPRRGTAAPPLPGGGHRRDDSGAGQGGR